MIKKYSLVFAAFLCFILSGFGQYAGTGTFTKITSLAQLTDGYYVIANEGDAFLMTNGRSGLPTTGYFISTAFTPSSGTITNPTTSNVWKIETSGGGRTIYNEGISKYVGWSSGNAASIEDAPADTNRWTFSYANSKFTVLNVQAPSQQLSYNTSAPRFATYSNNGQQELQLYKFTPTCTDAPDYYNIQSPTTTQTITVGNALTIYAQAYEPGITEAAGVGAGLVAWIGYSSTNNTPSSTGWTWVTAPFNVQVGNNDEFSAAIGASLAAGTYYYATRFQLNSCSYVYGGTGGAWNGTGSNSVQLIVQPHEVDFCNLQFPGVGSIQLGDPFAVYGQVYEAGLTPGVGQGAGITAQVGYSTTNTPPSTWTNWIAAPYNTGCTDTCNVLQNDEYSANLGGAISAGGTYYYATRFSLNSGPYRYGGILADGSAGNFWDGVTYISGVLTVNTPPILAITGTPTNHGSSCLGVPAAPVTYTITNTGSTSASGVTVTSNNAEFVVSSLSSTTIAANGGTATYVVTFTPASSGNRNANITVASTTSGSNSTVSSLSGIGSATVNPVVVTNTANAFTTNGANLRATSSTFGVCPPTTAKGFVYSLNSVNSSPQNGGTGVTTVAVGLGTQGAFNQTLNTLAEGTTYSYQAYLFDGTTYTYGGVQTFTTTITAPVNVSTTLACLEDTYGSVSWTPSTTAPIATGYMVFAVAAATSGTGGFTFNNSDYGVVNSDYSIATTYGSLGKLLYKGNATSVNITGLTENTVYSFRVVSYREGGSIRGFANATSAGSKVENQLAQDDVRNFTATPVTNQVTLNWLNPPNIGSACWDEILIVANQGAVVFTPTGNGSAYTANNTYSTPNQVVYKGAGTSRAIIGLTNNINYCFKAFVRRGTTWSDGVEICATPTLTYCPSTGNVAYKTGISRVVFGSINNPSSTPPDNNDYSDFTSQVANVLLGDLLDLSVNVNTDGNFTTYTKVWIDWNQDGTFNTTNEEYDLGTAYSAIDGPTSESPLSIEVPTTAAIGTTRMRVSNRFSAYSTPCATGFDGEVEDYSVNIQQPTGAEINVKGGAIPQSIPNGFSSPNGLNNTLLLGLI